MLPYTKVKKKITNPDIQYVNLNHIKKDFGLQEKDQVSVLNVTR